ncbi:MAG: FAD-dependent monooxygenase [Spirochaetota bacterium]
MGYRELELNIPLEYAEQQLRRRIATTLRSAGDEFSYVIIRKSLDARRKSDVHWTIRVGVTSQQIPGPMPEAEPELAIPYAAGRGRVIVTGSGPAGFFASLVLQTAGFQVTLVERGAEVDERSERIAAFESTGRFDPYGNYAYGEGGAGTFSDGKLTSRTKRISLEKRFVISRYIDAGAPEEIRIPT